MLKPNDKAQQEMVINGLADILLRAADGDEAIFCLPGNPCYVKYIFTDSFDLPFSAIKMV